MEGFSHGIPSGKLGGVEVGFDDPGAEGGRVGDSQEDSKLIHIFLGIRRVWQSQSFLFPLALGIRQFGKSGNFPVWKTSWDFSILGSAVGILQSGRFHGNSPV